MIRKDKGFTLIELLVVVAIIGILSSVVLASLSSARSRGRDAAIKSALANARAQSEIDADGSDYACNLTAGVMLNIANNVSSNGGTLHCSIDGNGDLIAFHADISTGNWCADSSGFNGPGTGALGVCSSGQQQTLVPTGGACTVNAECISNSCVANICS